MRNWQLNDTTNKFINYLKQFGEVDVFISTWNKENALKSWSQMHGLSNLDRCKNTVKQEDLTKFYNAKDVSIFNDDFYSSKYSPLRFNILTKNQFNWHQNGKNENGIIHSIKMYYLIHQANILKQYHEFLDGQEYNLVLRARPDFEFFEEKYKSFDFSKIESNILYIRKPPGSNICDQFAFGDSRIMDIYSSAFLKIVHLYENEIFGDPEEFLFYQLSSMGCKASLLNKEDELFGFGCLGSETVTHFKR